MSSDVVYMHRIACSRKNIIVQTFIIKEVFFDYLFYVKESVLFDYNVLA